MFKQWIIKQIVVCFLIITVATQDKKSDGNRPYEFGFTIEGQQHRHEAKDEKGLVMGEFGFITADGVYHVTVYATDEDGRFKILSMRSIKVSPPLDGSPDSSSVPIQGSLSDLQKSGGPSKGGMNKPATAAPRFGVAFSTTTSRPIDHSSIPLKATISTFNPPAVNEFTTPKPLPVASCGSCTLPSTTAAPPGTNPNKFVFQTPEFKNSPAPQSGFPQIDVAKLNKITSSHYFTMNQETPNANYPSVPEVPNRELLGPLNTPSPSIQNISPFSPRARKLDFNGNKFTPQSPNTLDDQDVISKPVPNDQRVGPVPSDLLIPTDVDKSRGIVRPVTKPIKPSIPEGLSFPGLIHPAKSRQVDGEQPQIDGQLPPGVTVDDMRELLYKFNYSVGFHGHYEMGYRNGVKIGGYYVNGRDGYSRIVEYVADERGYHPKVYYVFLGLDSPDTPKEETEKEYGLKGQVFEWYSIS